MNDINVLWLTILLVVAIILIYLLYRTISMTKPSSGNCGVIHATQPDVMWSDNCMYIKETGFDPTLKTPKLSLYLTKFTGNKDSKGIGANLWYRYRYVNNKTGGYSDFSPWSKSPVISGSKNLPCLNGDCTGVNYTGTDSCHSNVPVMSTISVDYDLESGVTANVHRVVMSPLDASPPTETTKDEIVGILTPSSDGWSVFDGSASRVCDTVTGMVCNIPGC